MAVSANNAKGRKSMQSNAHVEWHINPLRNPRKETSKKAI
jgi:hypothetical protein